MAGVGVAIGVGLALLLGQVGRALFFGLTPTDPLVPAAAVAGFARRRARRRVLARATRGARRSCYCIARRLSRARNIRFPSRTKR